MKDKDLAITKFDKGNGVCLMKKEDYLKKLDAIVNDETKFEKVNKAKRKNARHPLFRRQEVVNEQIKKHIKPYVDKELTKRLLASGTTVGKLYGTCKVHKDKFPVRPIVSMINTSEYNLAKYMDSIIKPGIPSTFSITSNSEFLQRLKNINQKSDDYCISFDIVSLFTNIPLDETISTIAETLYSKANTPPMPRESFVSLLKNATSGIFSHRQQLYKQVDGVSMGNPLAPTLANFFLGHLEKQLFSANDQCKEHPVLYLRYVDDIFCVFRGEVDYNQFLSKLNNLHPNLKYTFEFGGKTLPFLDTAITLTQKGFTSTVYRKRTDTGVVMNASAVAPTAWKSGLIKCFLHRAHTVCSDKKLLEDETAKLRTIFTNNGHSKQYFDKINNDFLDKTQRNDATKSAIDKNTENSTEANTQTRSKKLILKIPYIGKASIMFARRIRNLMKKVEDSQIRTVYGTTKIQEFIERKDVPPKEILSRVVYQFKCSSDSNANYIGYTNRTLKERVKEHLSGKTAISDHISVCATCKTKRITIEDFEILKCCRSKRDTAIYEALLIKKIKPGLNHQLAKPGYTWFLQVFN